MRYQKIRALQIVFFLLTNLVLLPAVVQAQEPVSTEALDDWFYSWLTWGTVLGIILGIVVGLAHLCRLQFQHSALNINSQARRKFWLWFFLTLAGVAILMFLHAWLIYPFESFSLSFAEAFGAAWFNYRTLIVILATLGTFTLAVFLTTRLKPDCRCRYAFLPGPRGR